MLASDDDVRQHVLNITDARLSFDGCIVPREKPRDGIFVGLRTDRPKFYHSSGSRVLWMPVSYHPWWFRYIKKVVRRVNSDSSLVSLLCSAFGTSNVIIMRVAWKNFLPSNASLLQYKA